MNEDDYDELGIELPHKTDSIDVLLALTIFGCCLAAAIMIADAAGWLG